MFGPSLFLPSPLPHLQSSKLSSNFGHLFLHLSCLGIQLLVQLPLLCQPCTDPKLQGPCHRWWCEDRGSG